MRQPGIKTIAAVGVAAALLLIASNLAAAPTWSKTYWCDIPYYGGSYPFWPSDIVVGADGGVYIVGKTTVGSIVVLAKLDPFGNVTWSRTLGAMWAFLPSLVATGDGGVAVAGPAEDYDAPPRLAIVKVSARGSIEWHRAYGQPTGSSIATAIFEMSDGGFLLSSPGLVLVRTDEDGLPLWQKSYGGPGHDVRPQIAPLPNGGIVLAAQTTSWGAGSEDLWMVFLDSTGSILSQRAYGGVYWDEPTGLRVTPDGGVLVAGITDQLFPGPILEPWLLKFTSAGALQWEKAYTVPGSDIHLGDVANWAIPLGGGIVLAASLVSPSGGDDDSLLFETDANGTVLWARSYRFSPETEGGFAPAVIDSGQVVAAGATTASGGRGLIFRTEAAGSINSACPAPSSPAVQAVDLQSTVTVTDAAAVVLDLPVTDIESLAPASTTVAEDMCTPNSPRIESVPWPLDFGAVDLQETVVLPIEIRNTGALAMWVSAMEVSPPFLLATSCAASSVAAGGACVAEVEFHPPSVGTFVGELTVESDDPATPILVIPILGEGTDIIFENGFESGDTSAWSATVP